MENIYHWFGFITFWITIVVTALWVISKAWELSLNYLSSIFGSLWTILEFVYHRKNFLEWVKDKERITRK